MMMKNTGMENDSNGSGKDGNVVADKGVKRTGGKAGVSRMDAEGMMLTEHFSLWEMVRSGTAIRFGIRNVPTERDIESMRALCRAVLEPLRRRFGRIIVTSGFRCKDLNERVGGSSHSQHLRGEAADIHVSCAEIADKFEDFIIKNTDFDQLIREPIVKGGNRNPRWLHVSFTTRRKNRHQVI